MRVGVTVAETLADGLADPEAVELSDADGDADTEGATDTVDRGDGAIEDDTDADNDGAEEVVDDAVEAALFVGVRVLDLVAGAVPELVAVPLDEIDDDAETEDVKVEVALTDACTARGDGGGGRAAGFGAGRLSMHTPWG